MKQFNPEHVELLAQTLCAALHKDNARAQEAFGGPVWDNLSTRQQGDWRRAAQAAMRTLAGNAHWLFTHCPEGHEFALEPDAEDGDPMTCIHCGAEYDDR